MSKKVPASNEFEQRAEWLFGYSNDEWARANLPIVRIAALTCTNGPDYVDGVVHHARVEQVLSSLLDDYQDVANHLQELRDIVLAGRDETLASMDRLGIERPG
jgi:hypothetical protein